MSHQHKRQKIADAYLEFFEDTKPSRINVKRLCEKVGISRKTFYYYFDDIESVSRWIFRKDLGKLLLRTFSEEELVYEENGPSIYAAFPYYSRTLDSGGYMHQRVFFACLIKSLYERKECYRYLFRDNHKDSFSDYLFNLYSEALYSDAKMILKECNLSELALHHIACWLTCAFLYEMILWVRNNDSPKRWQDMAPFNNTMHDVLYMYKVFPFDADEIKIALPGSSSPSPLPRSPIN